MNIRKKRSPPRYHEEDGVLVLDSTDDEKVPPAPSRQQEHTARKTPTTAAPIPVDLSSLPRAPTPSEISDKVPSSSNHLPERPTLSDEVPPMHEVEDVNMVDEDTAAAELREVDIHDVRMEVDDASSPQALVQSLEPELEPEPLEPEARDDPPEEQFALAEDPVQEIPGPSLEVPTPSTDALSPSTEAPSPPTAGPSPSPSTEDPDFLSVSEEALVDDHVPLQISATELSSPAEMQVSRGGSVTLETDSSTLRSPTPSEDLRTPTPSVASPKPASPTPGTRGLSIASIPHRSESPREDTASPVHSVLNPLQGLAITGTPTSERQPSIGSSVVTLVNAPSPGDASKFRKDSLVSSPRSLFSHSPKPTSPFRRLRMRGTLYAGPNGFFRDVLRMSQKRRALGAQASGKAATPTGATTPRRDSPGAQTVARASPLVTVFKPTNVRVEEQEEEDGLDSQETPMEGVATQEEALVQGRNAGDAMDTEADGPSTPSRTRTTHESGLREEGIVRDQSAAASVPGGPSTMAEAAPVVRS